MAPPPSRLAIATASVHRLLKEEASYRTELRSQEARLTRLQQGAEDDTDNDNREWEIGQERRAIEETKAVFGPLREKVLAAVEALEGMLMTSEGDESGEVTAAREAIEKAKAGDEGGGASV